MITSFHLLNCEIIVFYILSDSNIIRSMPEQTSEEQIVQKKLFLYNQPAHVLKTLYSFQLFSL